MSQRNETATPPISTFSMKSKSDLYRSVVTSLTGDLNSVVIIGMVWDLNGRNDKE
jgi:hypothetical protein